MSAVIRTHCDAAIAEAQPAAPGVSPAGLVLVTAILASSLDFIDGSVLNVGLPAIAAGLNVAGADLPWVYNIYLLPLAALLLIGGAAGDLIGRRRLMVVGSAIFAAASVVAAMAPDFPWLLAGRGVQGVGAAMVIPNSLAILGGAFSGEAKGRAIGIWAAAASVAAAIGPVAGGRLIDMIGWRAIFIIEVPMALAALALAWSLANDRPEGRHAPLDIGGAIFATAGLGLLIWGLTIGAGPGGWSAAAIAALGAAVVLLFVFIGIEHRGHDQAMMPLAMFASARLVGLTVLTLLLYGALALFFLLVPYLLIETAGYSSTAAGAAVLPFPLVLAAASPTAGKLAARLGERGLLTVGPLLVAAGFSLIAELGTGSNYWTMLLPAILVIALGMACAAAPLTNAVLGAIDSRHAGTASGLNSAVAQLGGLIATALLAGLKARS